MRFSLRHLFILLFSFPSALTTLFLLWEMQLLENQIEPMKIHYDDRLKMWAHKSP